MKARVTGRVRTSFQGDTYIVEMRPDGFTARRLHGRTRYEVPIDHVLELVKSLTNQDAEDKREGRKVKIAGIRRANRDKGQTLLPFEYANVLTGP